MYSNAVVFMANGEFRRIIQKGEDRELSLGEIAIAGAFAGSVMSFFNCPIELLKVKLQTQDPKGVIGKNGALEPAVSRKRRRGWEED
jgi:solute carrier family 25 carnitine/acylcarnitine transporter 20/29